MGVEVVHDQGDALGLGAGRGDVLQDPQLGYALAFGMIIITGISNGIYIWMRARSERWLK